MGPCIIYTENTKSIFGKNINVLVKKLAPLLLAEFLGFGTESDITRLSYSGFARNFATHAQIWRRGSLSQPNNLGQNKKGVWGKCAIAPLGGFWQKYANIGDPIWTQN